MRVRILFPFSSLIAVALLLSATSVKAATPPKLIILVVDNGLRRVRDEGIYYPQAAMDDAVTKTRLEHRRQRPHGPGVSFTHRSTLLKLMNIQTPDLQSAVILSD